MPKAAQPLQAAVPAGARRCDQSAEPEKKKIPSTTKAIPPIFSTVSTDWTFPPRATAKQFKIDKNKMAPTATSCLGPNCQSRVWPRSDTSRRAQTAFRGKKAARKIANPEPRLAMEALPATMNRCHPKRKAAASP